MLIRGPRLAARRLARFCADVGLMVFFLECLVALAIVVSIFFFL